jgi:hypothetical protein
VGVVKWLVRRGLETFLRDLEADGDDDLDEVFFPVTVHEERPSLSGLRFLDDRRFGIKSYTTRRPLDTPSHLNHPMGPRHIEQTVTREQYHRAAARAAEERA